ncbi:unnamed protein product [Fusarium graminearum]|uniref:Uncharacterized protein n=1 Tax=Gibberella zeae TaxID=5518 RepID=A0A4E9DWW5_GIBZA|nr:unnamed protein product [Fusarium graminearum]CAF3443809.1 unnamed protein product [Fusarium graminearum]CAG2014301.1 unnamed protein product [Fusarium graminearum]
MEDLVSLLGQCDIVTSQSDPAAYKGLTTFWAAQNNLRPQVIIASSHAQTLRNLDFAFRGHGYASMPTKDVLLGMRKFNNFNCNAEQYTVTVIVGVGQHWLDVWIRLLPGSPCPTVADYKLWRVINTHQALAILGYENSRDGKANFATEYNAQFIIAGWSVIAPFDKEVCLTFLKVILRSCFQESDTNKDPTPIHMVVFRSVQGEFVPVMSDSSDYQYWRIIKTDAGERHIKPGDNIRLCWDFRDQTVGWRDFTQDVFGRREVRRPSDVPTPLFIKIPWLRVPDLGPFQFLGSRYNGYEINGPLHMSAEREDYAERNVKVHMNGNDGVSPCRLQHLQLRIDSVGQGGRGDTEDYLLKMVGVADSGKTQKTPVTDTNKSPSPPAPPQQGFHMWLHQAALLFGL